MKKMILLRTKKNEETNFSKLGFQAKSAKNNVAKGV
jgi:hypothetical protein